MARGVREWRRGCGDSGRRASISVPRVSASKLANWSCKARLIELRRSQRLCRHFMRSEFWLRSPAWLQQLVGQRRRSRKIGQRPRPNRRAGAWIAQKPPRPHKHHLHLISRHPSNRRQRVLRWDHRSISLSTAGSRRNCSAPGRSLRSSLPTIQAHLSTLPSWMLASGLCTLLRMRREVQFGSMSKHFVQSKSAFATKSRTITGCLGTS